MYSFKLTYYETTYFLILIALQEGPQKKNPSGIILVLEFITLAISIITDSDSHLLIKHAITAGNQRILKNDVILALM